MYPSCAKYPGPLNLIRNCEVTILTVNFILRSTFPVGGWLIGLKCLFVMKFSNHPWERLPSYH